MTDGTIELDFKDDYRQTRDLVDVPLVSGDVADLTSKVKAAVDAAHLLFPDEETLIRRLVTGLLAGHVILAGPPGTGKTTLAKLIAEVFDCTFQVETATADWSTYDVIGGLQPKITQQGGFQVETIAPWEGHVTRALLECASTVARNRDDGANHPNQAHWLVIDEFNRAEIDRAIGGLYTVLGGGSAESLKLWYEQDPNKAEVWMPGRFRMIGTLNSVDTSYVYGFSQGLTRRFKYVYVGVPAASQVTEEIARAILQALEWVSVTYPAPLQEEETRTRVEGVADTLVAIVKLVRYGSAGVPGWPVGTAQIVDVLRDLALQARSTADLASALDLAVADLIVPQMMDLTATQLDRIEEAFTAGVHSDMKRTAAALSQLREAQNTSFA